MILRTASGRRGLIALLVMLSATICSQQLLGGAIAYQVPAGVVGNQADAGGISFGMDFAVNSNLVVSQLGVFDSSQNGLIAPIQAAIFDRVTETVISPIVTFASGSGTGSGTLSGGSRFLAITPLLLHAGFQGSIVTFGYGDGTSGELDGNSFGLSTGTPSFPWTTNDGGGLISFIGGGRYSNSGGAIMYPPLLDSGPANRYAAGTFEFAAVPEPSGLAMGVLAAGLLAASATVIFRRPARRSRTDGLPASS